MRTTEFILRVHVKSQRGPKVRRGRGGEEEKMYLRHSKEVELAETHDRLGVKHE